MNEQEITPDPATLPKTLDEAVTYLLPRFAGFEKYPDRGEDDFAAFCQSQLSGGIGMQIRNALQLWIHESPLHQYFLTEHNLFHADDMSDLIIRAIYRKIFEPKSEQQFDINHQYQLYLGRVALTEDRMHPEQRIQLKQAFFGAWGQLLICMRDEISALPENDGMNVLEKMIEQVGHFWLVEVEQYKARNQ